MAYSHSSYPGSPAHYESPEYSPTMDDTSEQGSQYEVDLSALGLNSTFDTIDSQAERAAHIDVVETSDIGGPEDFTMNMTYWMTADLPLSHIKSRKEANARLSDLRGDMQARSETSRKDDQGATMEEEATAEGDRVVIDDSAQDRMVSDNTVRQGGENKDYDRSRAELENDEKVLSYLSGLPDTEMPGATTSTPHNKTRTSMLQVPSPTASRPPMSRPDSRKSMQPTVEDYDTPRKPTQETVIHHPLPELPTEEPEDDGEDLEYNALQVQVAQLQGRLDQQELSSKTRIAELETILSYTRSEMDTARNEIFQQKEHIKQLQGDDERRKHDQEIADADMEERLAQKDRELSIRLEEFGEELRLQNLAKLQSQRDEFEKQMQEVDQARNAAEGQAEEKDRLIAQLQQQLDRLRESHQHEHQIKEQQRVISREHHENKFLEEKESLNEKLSDLQRRAEELQTALEKATTEAQVSREQAAAAQEESKNAREAAAEAQSARTASETQTPAHTARIPDLESSNAALKTQIDSLRADLSAKDQQILTHISEQDALDQRLSAAEGRAVGLESTLATLRQQLSTAHRDLAKARTEVERLENDNETLTDRLDDASKEADRRVQDLETKLGRMREQRAEWEEKYKELQCEARELREEHEDDLEEVRDKAEEAVRKVGAMLETERAEKRRLTKELRRAKERVDELTAQLAEWDGKKVAHDSDTTNDDSSMMNARSDSKDLEIANLRTLVRTQADTVKTLKSDIRLLRKGQRNSPPTPPLSSYSESEIEALHAEIATLNSTIKSLRSQLEIQQSDFDAQNKAMDERLAAMLSKFLKERSRALVGKRDEQWVENVGKLSGEKELLGKVLMREWGRGELGPSEDKENVRKAREAAKEKEREKVKATKGQGKGQLYSYQYVTRT